MIKSSSSLTIMKEHPSLQTTSLDQLAQTLSDDTLYIIGNGFDLMHGVKSSYHHFRDSIGSRNIIGTTMESYIHRPDLWGDFENSLAYLDRAMMMGTIDDWLQDFNVLDEDDDEFSAADYFLAQETATGPIPVLTEQLPRRFRQWVNTLTVDPSYAPLAQVLRTGCRFINFNYTEFLETNYSIPRENITYIHGDRRDRNQQLVLGHGRDEEEVLNEWYETNKHKAEYQPIRHGRKGRTYRNDNPVYLAYFLTDDSKGNWRSQVRYDTIDNTRSLIEEYYSASAKKTQDVLKKHRTLFEELGTISNIVVIGHSLSEVDHPYFTEIIEHTKDPYWYCSWYDDRSIQSITAFIDRMIIPKERVSIFSV